MTLKIDKSNIMMRIGFYLCLLYVLMRPFLTNYVTGYYKYLFICIMMCALIVAVLFGNSLNRIGLTECALMIIFYVYVIFNSYLCGGTELLSYTVERYIFYSIPIFIFPYICNRIKWKQVLNFLVAFGVIDAIISIIEFLTRTRMFPMSDGDTTIGLVTQAGDYIIRTYGLQGSYFLLAEILCICGLASFYMYWHLKEKLQIIPFVIITIGIFTTGSRGYYVSYILGLLLLYICEGTKKNNSLKKFTRTILIGIAIIVALYILLGTNISTGNDNIDIVLKRIRMIFDWTGDSANSARINHWNWAINYWKESPLFGHGACCTETRYSGYISVTESGFLKRLVELGLIGTVLQYLTMLIPLLKGINRYRRGEIGGVSILFFSILFAFFVEDLILQRYTGMEYTIISWTILSCLAYSPLPSLFLEKGKI